MIGEIGGIKCPIRAKQKRKEDSSGPKAPPGGKPCKKAYNWQTKSHLLQHNSKSARIYRGRKKKG